MVSIGLKRLETFKNAYKHFEELLDSVKRETKYRQVKRNTDKLRPLENSEGGEKISRQTKIDCTSPSRRRVARRVQQHTKKWKLSKKARKKWGNVALKGLHMTGKYQKRSRCQAKTHDRQIHTTTHDYTCRAVVDVRNWCEPKKAM